MSIHVNALVSESRLSGNFGYPDTGDTAQHIIVLGPKAKTGSNWIGGIKPEQLMAVKNRTAYLYLYGWAKYRDVFDKTPWHITKFCFEMTQFGACQRL
jgi:hypothetical protein